MKLRLRNRHSTDTAHNVISDKEEVVGLAQESYSKEYWLLAMSDSPRVMRFEKLSDVTKYVVKLTPPAQANTVKINQGETEFTYEVSIEVAGYGGPYTAKVELEGDRIEFLEYAAARLEAETPSLIEEAQAKLQRQNEQYRREMQIARMSL